MHVIRRGHHHCVGEFGHLEHLAPVAEAMLGGYAVCISHPAAAVLENVGHAHHLYRFGILLEVAGIYVAAVSGAYNHHCYLPGSPGLKRAYGETQVVEGRLFVGKRCIGCSYGRFGSCFGSRKTKGGAGGNGTDSFKEISAYHGR